jgi:hypothetical protein
MLVTFGTWTYRVTVGVGEGTLAFAFGVNVETAFVVSREAAIHARRTRATGTM